MWIPEYHRGELPEGVDHSEWGVEVDSAPLTDPTSAWASTRTIMISPGLDCPPSATFGSDGTPSEPEPYYLRATRAESRSAFTEPVAATLFMPDHALLVDDAEPQILRESLWHSHLFFSDYFRNDASTDWKWRLRPEWTPDVTYGQVINHCYHRFSFQYFHWFMDVLPKVWLLKCKSPYAEPGGWFLGSLEQPFQLPSLALFDIGLNDCVFPEDPWPESPAAIRDGPVVRFEQAVCPAFTFTEGLRTRPSFDSGVHHKGWSREYFEDVRDRALSRFTPEPGRGGQRLYITRKDATHRRIINEEAVVNLVLQHGFTIVDPGALDFEGQVRTFAGASVVLGVHGAGLTNVIWSGPDASVIELIPELIEDAGYRFMCNLLGTRHEALICRQMDSPLGPAFADIEVNCDALRSLLIRAA